MGAYLSRPKTEKDSAEGENADFEWGVCAMQGWRMDMEDAHAIELDLQSDGKPKASMFGVFDGHGGKEVARFTAMHIAKQLLGTQQFHQSQLKEALVETYLGLDEVMAQEETREQLRELAGGSSEKGADADEGEGEEDPMITLKQMRQLNGGRQEYVGPMAGCTAVVALVVVANAGDSRCVVSRRGQAVDMSHDHKPTDPREESRINRAGCFVADGRINGSLNLSRALGDFEHKQAKDLPVAEQAVTAMPDVLELDLEDGIEFMVIDFVRERLKAGESPKAICAQACDHCLAEDTEGCGKGCDNMSIMVVVFKQLANGYKNG
eukprot:jgi/Astpho2/8906/Aster-08257